MSSRLTIKNHLDRGVRGSVEETLNALLEAEADRCAALRTQRGTPGHTRDERSHPGLVQTYATSLESDIQRIATGLPEVIKLSSCDPRTCNLATFQEMPVPQLSITPASRQHVTDSYRQDFLYTLSLSKGRSHSVAQWF